MIIFSGVSFSFETLRTDMTKSVLRKSRGMGLSFRSLIATYTVAGEVILVNIMGYLKSIFLSM